MLPYRNLKYMEGMCDMSIKSIIDDMVKPGEKIINTFRSEIGEIFVMIKQTNGLYSIRCYDGHDYITDVNKERAYVKWSELE